MVTMMPVVKAFVEVAKLIDQTAGITKRLIKT
jgi:hypothetical protein